MLPAISQKPFVTPPDDGKERARKVLIITYYWPPSGGSGVQRWLKFVKYLPSFGWQPYVFTPENPSFEIRDDTLMKDIPPEAEVMRFPIWEPYHIFRALSKFFGKTPASQIDQVSVKKKGFFQRITAWIRGNFFIPDARIYWVRPSAKFLTDFIASNNIRTIITTGPPHSLHLIGRKLKKKDPSLRWIADFRDPWSEWDFLDTLSLTSWARSEHRKMERKVLKNADKVITIAPYHVERLIALGARNVELITNGFDEDDFRDIERKQTGRFTIRHIGMVDELRDPAPFMEAVKAITLDNPEFQKHITVEFIGAVNSSFRNRIQQDAILSGITVFSKPVNHHDLLQLYGTTDVQLLVLAHTALAAGNLPGKFFEYLASGNFIFGIGPETGDAAKILLETKAGIMIERSRSAEIKARLLESFDRWRVGRKEEARDVSAYSRRGLTKNLAALLEA